MYLRHGTDSTMTISRPHTSIITSSVVAGETVVGVESKQLFSLALTAVRPVLRGEIKTEGPAAAPGLGSKGRALRGGTSRMGVLRVAVKLCCWWSAVMLKGI